MNSGEETMAKTEENSPGNAPREQQDEAKGGIAGAASAPAAAAAEAVAAAAPAAPAAEGKAKGRTRNSYTHCQKELIVMADKEGGRKKRLEVAHLIGMPAKTADHIVALYKMHGKDALYDARHDRRTHLGKGAKKDLVLLKLMSEWMHLDAKLTHRQVRDLVNLEIFRRILKGEGLALSEEEQAQNGPISVAHIEEYFELEQVKEKYRKQHVENESTIAHWMDGLIMSRKYLLDDSNTINNEDNRAVRLAFARDLLRALEDEQALIVFIDEVPLWLTMTHPPGRGADTKIHEFTHVFMGVTPRDGLLYSRSFVAEKLVPEQKHGLQHNAPHFKRFLNELIEHLMENEGSRIRGKSVYFVADCPQEYLDSVEQHKSLHSVPAWEKLCATLAEGGTRPHLVKMAMNSPPLNLGEYLNRRLRHKANSLLHELVIEERQHADFLKHSESGHHNHLLDKVIKQCLSEMEAEGTDSAALVRLTDAVRDACESEGAIDFPKAYTLLFE